MEESLQFKVMSRLNELFDRLLRVLASGERLLDELSPPPEDSGVFARHLALRWEGAGRSGMAGGSQRGRLLPIEEPDRFDLEDLVGVDRAVENLVRNFEQFMGGFSSNHVLLYGDRGTGKSSAVKGLLGRFGAEGLRIIEVGRDDLSDLPAIFDLLRGAPYRFVLFCDDLSFDPGESRHRQLKAALDGSLAAPPANVRIVATSNRRHLLPESMSDNRAARLDDDGELHMGEAVEEKLALADRFGLVLGFYSFDQATYLSIVDHYARKVGVLTESDVLRAEALRWALNRSNRSGRIAKQFVDDFAGREALLRNPARDSRRP